MMNSKPAPRETREEPVMQQQAQQFRLGGLQPEARAEPLSFQQPLAHGHDQEPQGNHSPDNQSSADQNQAIIRINLEDQQEGDEDLDEYLGDIDGIMQYQHKILRKYAMLGMIKYSAVPFFHQLVTSRDYKMICIFEVFA